MSDGRQIRTFSVTVQGFPPHNYSARSRGKALAQAWRAYRSTFDASEFRDFLRIATARQVPNPPGIGDRILVGGLPATRVIGWGQYVYFMRDGSDEILCSHPLDVQEINALATPAARLRAMAAAQESPDGQ